MTARIGLLSSFTIENLVPYLQFACLKSGIYADVYLGGYNQFQTLIRNPGSELYAFHPELVFLVAEPGAIVAGLPGLPSSDSMALVSDALNGLIAQFRTCSAATLVVHNLALPTHFV